MSWKCQHLGIQPASSRLWFWEIAQQPYETMCPDLWFGEQGHCVHDSKKLPSKPRKLATEVQGTESPSSSFTLGQVHDCWERELGGPWSSLSPPFPEDEAVPEVLSTCPPPPRALRGRIHSQDHGLQTLDWQRLAGHLLSDVHQPVERERARARARERFCESCRGVMTSVAMPISSEVTVGTLTSRCASIDPFPSSHTTRK